MTNKPLEIAAEKTDKYNRYKNENITLTQENVKLTARVKELWQQAANLDMQVLTRQQENEALKAKLESLNEAARNNLAKKNIVPLVIIAGVSIAISVYIYYMTKKSK